jgi:chromosome segregation protein
LLILKRVELQGFKSFCDRTEMRFPGRGIAAIVGPNGCGKSNLSDAISWVLGEQSAKSLRGSRMEDVIFAGTRDRKPLGMAQVTLTLLDPEGNTPIPGLKPSAKVEITKVEDPAAATGSNGHSDGSGLAATAAAPPPPLPPLEQEREIIITRRLFRSGESEYLINGKLARLRDIQELFMGTGLGPESYAIIEQGRIGQILSSKPLDRRAIIEEAAGVSKFKTKRRLAEAKLEGAKQNLTRVFDILEEVTRQVNSLKRQAGKARRFDELKTELDQWLRTALAGRYALLEQEAAGVAIELGNASRHYQALQAQVESEEQALTAIRDQAWHTETELTGARQQLSAAQVESERIRGQIQAQARQVASIEQRLQQGETETTQLAERFAALQQERATLTAALDQLHAAAEEVRQRLQAKNEEREALLAQLHDRERAIEAARLQIVRLLGDASSLRNQLGQIETHLAALDRDAARVRHDEESASADLQRLETAKAEFSGKLAARQLALDTLTGRRQLIDEDLHQRRAALSDTRQRLEALRSETSRLRARRDSLEEILSHRAYTTESVKRLFTAVERNQAGGLKPAGVLADYIELTDPRFEKATEEFLHDELEYVVVRNWDEVAQGLELLKGDVDGRATFLVEPSVHGDPADVFAAAVPEPPIGPETGIAGRLSDGIRFTNGLTNAPAALLPRLARCYLAEDRDAAQLLSRQYPDVYFLLSDGVCYHGHAVTGGRRTGSGPLALKRELRELNALHDERQAALTAAQTQVESLEGEIQTLTEELEAVRAELQSQEKETLLLDQEMRKVTEELHRANQRLSVARLELERLTRESTSAREQFAAKQALVEQKETERAVLETSLETQRALLEDIKAQATSLAEEHSVLRVELAGFEERRRGVESAAARLDEQIYELARRRQDLAAEMEMLGVQRARLLEHNLELDRQAAALAASLEQMQAQVAAFAEREQAERAALTEKEELLKLLRAASAESQERRSQVEVDLVRRQSDLRHLDENCRKDLNVGLSELTAAADPNVPTPDDMAVAEAEEKVAELRRRIEALGPVNAEALAEYQESQQRYDFLNTQRQDLIDSIRDTEKAIHEIDTESRRRFVDAFEVINENFKVMFRSLFGGGTGEMRLTGEGDTLDQGIEIVAQPPGKRLQNVLLLSGGEKAITALALLMAIFQYQPSPFCILDEVDAPLDEANVARLTLVLKEMAAQTQFVVITHAKKTMESAESLYGVTMQEQGVSKLVSVRLQAPPPPPPPNLQMAARV